MNMTVTPTPSLKTLQKQLKGTTNGAEKVMRRAIDNTVRRTQTEVVKQVRKEYIVTAKDVKPTLKIRRSRAGSLSGSVTSTSQNKIKLYKFDVDSKQPQPSSPPSSLMARVKRTNSTKALMGSSDRSKAFVAQMKSGHISIFQRQLGTQMKSKKKEKIAEMTGAAVPSAIRDLKVYKPLLDDSRRYLYDQIEKQVRRFLEA